jgi:hypothetical protein
MVGACFGAREVLGSKEMTSGRLAMADGLPNDVTLKILLKAWRVFSSSEFEDFLSTCCNQLYVLQNTVPIPLFDRDELNCERE